MRPLLIILVLLAGCGPTKQVGFDCELVRVVDGDTIEVRLNDGTLSQVKLYGIDAPEPKQPFFAESKQHLSDLITGFHQSGHQFKMFVYVRGRDQLGRISGDIRSGNGIVNRRMIREGLAWHVKSNNSEPRLVNDETQARLAKRGLWADPKPIPPWEWRENEAKQNQ